jgi:hypothetical protein
VDRDDLVVEQPAGLVEVVNRGVDEDAPGRVAPPAPASEGGSAALRWVALIKTGVPIAPASIRVLASENPRS